MRRTELMSQLISYAGHRGDSVSSRESGSVTLGPQSNQEQ